MKAFLTAGLALATCAAFAAIPTQDFAETTAGESPSGAPWYGDGGKYAAKTSGSNDMVLAIEGSMICSNATGAVESEFVKTSFEVKAPEEGTATADLPTGDEVAGCQIAVATGPATGDNLKVMVFSKTNATEAGWAETGLTVPTNEWFEVALSFNYESNTASIQISSQEIGSQVAGPFTNVTESAATAKINSLNFVGSTEIDDVGIDEALAKSQLPSNLEGLMVYTNSLPSSVTLEKLAANEGNNNYAKHIEAGLTPSEDELAFNATALSTVTENNVVKTVITVPCDADFGQVYKVVVTKADGTEISDSPVAAEAGDISSGSRALKFVVPTTDEKVLKFTVQSGNGN